MTPEHRDDPRLDRLVREALPTPRGVDWERLRGRISAAVARADEHRRRVKAARRRAALALAGLGLAAAWAVVALRPATPDPVAGAPLAFGRMIPLAVSGVPSDGAPASPLARVGIVAEPEAAEPVPAGAAVATEVFVMIDPPRRLSAGYPGAYSR